MLLHPKYEVFCRRYAATGNATQAARDADFAYEHAANQAYRLLKRADVQARLAEIATEKADREAQWEADRAERHARLAHLSATEAEALLLKLDPIYEGLLDDGDHEGVMKVIALQARIAGLLGEDEGARKSGARSRKTSSEDGR